ncbi:hypothetical protein LOB55_03715 [Lactobacillus delbrueckii subsp. lactis]|jgi:hypothetical protein|uniref:hypothetical protein n=1 Tax=Lactobacillales TaxID=186826 RepID=UPI0001EC34E8|nr:MULTISPECIES: hypothetical protein [Lactobacillales]ADQ61257.1 Hypothetical protein LDBND_1222 [Lactobacillus delbrueckii subsp. bulgaricus ND02]MBO3081424.1 hypothetical protein [Lactobacillus delbrueckii subsp. bulgaricus]MCD5438053.1 hypothetical protein [Lactobacillus delbrueckii subsp. lactis]MCD5468647.1 hypothetical protein [Lactobacillus delbrueckii subsp. lactis]MCZ0795571.1 hypothetical protein [Lactobacillus delbrueckii subsp. lactis]
MVEQIRMMNAYLQAALEGREQVCQEIVYNYAHVYRKPVRDVLAMISVGLMDPTGFSHKDYHKIKEMMIKQVSPRWERLGFNSEEEMKENEQRYNNDEQA